MKSITVKSSNHEGQEIVPQHPIQVSTLQLRYEVTS